MNIKLHLDNVRYSTKPSVSDISKKQTGLNDRILNQVTTITPKKLAESFSQGYTAVLGVHDTFRRKNNLIEQQVLALDFDNTLPHKVNNKKVKTTGSKYTTIEEILEHPFIKDNAAFIYKTFSYTPEWEKFRVVFILESSIKNTDEITHYYQELMDLFPTADKATKDSTRIFFGGTEYIEIDFDNCLGLSEMSGYVTTVGSVQTNKVAANESFYSEKLTNRYVNDVPTWLLIKQGNKDRVRERLSEIGGIKVYDHSAAMEVLTHLNMKDILGIYHNPFNDILLTDNHPSCGIWKTEGDTWLYTRQGNVGQTGGNVSKTIVQVISELLGSKGHPANYMQTIEYLSDVMDIQVERTENLREIKGEAEIFKQILLSNDFKVAYPAIYQIFGRYKYQTVINAILDVFLFNIYEDKETGEIRCLSWISEKNLAARVGVSPSKIKRMLNLMTLVGTIDKLGNDSIPSNLLMQIETNRTQYKSSNGEYVPRATERERRSSVYEVPKLMMDFLKISERCEILVGKGFTTKALSKEYVVRTLGESEADRVYPQDKGRVITKKSKEITTDIHKAILTKIEEKGYAIINEVKEEIEILWGSKGFTEYKYQQALGELLDTYDLEKKTMNNQLKKEFNITHLNPQARPTILVKATN